MSESAVPPDRHERATATPAGEIARGETADTAANDSATSGAPGLRAVRVAWDRLLDVVVYVPVGFATETVEHLPQWAATGRARLGLQLGNARVTGQFVVRKAERDLGQRLTNLRPGGRHRAAPSRPAPTDDRAATPPGRDLPPHALLDDVPGAPGPVTLPSARTTTAAAAAAIEGYDTLSASQVVRRLDGLGPEELRAVYRHEAATRGRRTILHRVQQLLNPAAASGDQTAANGVDATSATSAFGPANGANGTAGGAGTVETT